MTDAEPPVFRAMLEFLYAGIWPKAEMAVDVLLLADKYGVDDLKEICWSILFVGLCNGEIFRNGGVKAVLEIHELADRMGQDELRNRARSVIQENVVEEFSEEDRAKLRENPELLFDIFEETCSQLFRPNLKWGPREGEDGSEGDGGSEDGSDGGSGSDVDSDGGSGSDEEGDSGNDDNGEEGDDTDA